MEKNIHNDGLEDFLRKSFEQYDDSPSDGLWDKIEADLSSAPKVAPIGSAKKYWMAAAAAVLIALMAGQYIYFQKEKAELVKLINIQGDKIEALEKELLKKEKEITDTYESKIINPENLFNKNSFAETINPLENKQKDIAIHNYSINKKNNITTQSTKKQSENTENKNSLLNTNSKENTDKKPDTQLLTENLVEDQAYFEKQIVANSNIPGLIDLINLKRIEHPNPNLSVPTTIIDPVSKKGRFSIGIHHSYLSTNEKMARAIRRPLGGPDRVFYNTKAMTGTTQLTGLSTVYQTKTNWLFETGINYRKTELSATHSSQLRFMDRLPNNNQQPTFEYALNTSVGVVDIEMRADQTDPNQTINEFENIRIEIEAKQEIDYVSIPFMVGKEIGNGKLSTSVKSGLLINFLTHQSLGVSGNIINDNLQNTRTYFTRRNGIGLKNTTTDFIAVFGFNYELNKRCSIHLSPTAIVPMGSRHNDPYIKSSGLSFGADLGLFFNF